MKSSLAQPRNWTRLAQSLAALSVAALALPTTSRAATISGLVETSTSLTFNFSGTSENDFLTSFLPTLTFWSLASETHGFPQAGPFLLGFGRIRHTGGPDGSVFVFGAYGTTQSSTDSFAHAGGVDVYSLTATVNGVQGADGWSSYSGSFSAVHVNAPDGGSAAGLAGLALLALAGARRFLRTA